METLWKAFLYSPQPSYNLNNGLWLNLTLQRYSVHNNGSLFSKAVIILINKYIADFKTFNIYKYTIILVLLDIFNIILEI